MHACDTVVIGSYLCVCTDGMLRSCLGTLLRFIKLSTFPVMSMITRSSLGNYCLPQNNFYQMEGCLTSTVTTWRGCLHLRQRGYRYHSLSYYHWMILLSRDVESNPGPVKFPCTQCCKAEKQNDQASQCNRCENWSHTVFCGISHKQYQLHTKLGDTKEWLCHTCIVLHLPI